MCSDLTPRIGRGPAFPRPSHHDQSPAPLARSIVNRELDTEAEAEGPTDSGAFTPLITAASCAERRGVHARAQGATASVGNAGPLTTNDSAPSRGQPLVFGRPKGAASSTCPSAQYSCSSCSDPPHSGRCPVLGEAVSCNARRLGGARGLATCRRGFKLKHLGGT